MDELRRIWVAATPDSIGGDLERARGLVEALPEGDEREAARRFLEALERLERWLRDY